ncbi:MAG: universal stress protein [Syntrophomonadaceae bacterium]|jgi:nucleotide-binding universal stress UspA family protein|nr:universal stress protein [Syntrophomonadaceae bacterium]
MFKQILVPVDGSDYATNAAKKALVIAQKHDSKITLLHVINHSQLFSMGAPQSLPLITDHMIDGAIKGAEKILEDTKEAIGAREIEVETRIEWGTPAQVIINLARNQACDLIVMGSRGLSKMSGLFLGSVSDRVAKVAPCPVMLIKE